MMVSISGDFDSAAMEAKLRAVFEPLPRGTKIESPQLDYPGPTPGVNFADKPDVNQSTVFLVGLGTEQSNPDYYALSIMNEVFSGGFGSRLFQIRAHQTRSGLRSGRRVQRLITTTQASFTAPSSPKSASTVPATQAVSLKRSAA